LIHFPSSGTPFWTEGLILVLAVVGGAAGWVAKGVPGADSRAPLPSGGPGGLRFLGFYTLLMLLTYSAIPYKTPWCLLGFLRGLARVEWWNGVPESAPSAPVILVTPDMERALVRKLYDLPPPGERELYVSIFERPVELRPQVELRGYAASRLWEDYNRIRD